jgi:hypothetical protein
MILSAGTYPDALLRYLRKEPAGYERAYNPFPAERRTSDLAPGSFVFEAGFLQRGDAFAAGQSRKKAYTATSMESSFSGETGRP